MPVPCFQNIERGDSVRSAVVPSSDRKPVRSDALLNAPSNFRAKGSTQGKLAEGAFRGSEANNSKVVPDDESRAGGPLVTAEEGKGQPAAPRFRPA